MIYNFSDQISLLTNKRMLARLNSADHHVLIRPHPPTDAANAKVRLIIVIILAILGHDEVCPINLLPHNVTFIYNIILYLFITIQFSRYRLHWRPRINFRCLVMAHNVLEFDTKFKTYGSWSVECGPLKCVPYTYLESGD